MNPAEFLTHIRVKAVIATAEEERARTRLEATERRWEHTAREKKVWRDCVAIESKRGVSQEPKE